MSASRPLPPPRKSGGKPLFDCLRERESRREYDFKPLPEQLLSDLLWATFGISRPDGKRTAPTAFDCREFDLYLFTASGVARYDAEYHALIPILDRDHRRDVCANEWIPTAPLDIVFIADYARMNDCPPDMRDYCATADVGFICENLSLSCASEELSSCVIGSFDADKLRVLLSLRSEQKILMAQTVGFPK